MQAAVAKLFGGFNKKLDENINRVFFSLGIPACINGYFYMREAIKIIVLERGFGDGITKRVYPGVAKKFNTTPGKVERSIRHAIEVGFNRGRIDKINSLFQITAFLPKEKPTNGEFIAFLAEQMLLVHYDELEELRALYGTA